MTDFDSLSKREKEHAVQAATAWFWGKRIGIGVLLFVIFLLGLGPHYGVYRQTLAGEAELSRTNGNRQIVVNEAKAKREAAEYWKEAEIKRAEGAARANEILKNSLGGSEGYLRWLYIQMLEETENSIIYIPTEASLPVLEAGKR